jgi:ribonuclease P/MRP protein subunit RPP40
MRLPSMVRGKKGFERVLWACKDVFDHSLAWLFYDMNATTKFDGPIAAHYPIVRSVKPTVSTLAAAVCPKFPAEFGPYDDEDAPELLEWLSLINGGCSQVLEAEHGEANISRYREPTFGLAAPANEEQHEALDLVHYQWHAFIPHSFATKVLLTALKTSNKGWFAITAAGFHGHSYTMLKHGDKIVTWKYAG